MSDDTREREPLRDLGDNPPEQGVRGDLAGTSEGGTPVAPGADNVGRIEQQVEGDADGEGNAPAVNPLADVEHPTADE